jgi:acetyl esterase/lipase
MLARSLLFLSLAQAALIYLPLPTWALWMAHFAALEGCLIGAITGLGALALGKDPYTQGLAILGVIAALLPALAVIPAYLREGQRFSPIAWVIGGPRQQVAVRREVALSPGLVADVYPAPGPGPHPFVMVVHGGSWRSGDKGDVPHVSHSLAIAGYTVLDVRYRLAPQHPFPAAVEDVKCLLGQAQSRAAELGIDPARGALLGRSAGGQIALLAAYSDSSLPPSCAAPDPAPPPLRAVISIYGPTDLAWGHDNPFVPDVVDGTRAVELYLGGPPTAAPEAYRLATPQSWAHRPVPPTLLLHGTGERCVRPDNAGRLHDALERHGHRPRTVFIPFADHGFDVRPGGLGEQLARGVLLDFLRENL